MSKWVNMNLFYSVVDLTFITFTEMTSSTLTHIKHYSILEYEIMITLLYNSSTLSLLHEEQMPDPSVEKSEAK